MPSVLIIGASRGIGLELARQYLEDGWDVHITTRSNEVPAPLSTFDNKPRHYILDIRDMPQINAMVEALANAPIDLLIMNAAVNDRVPGRPNAPATIPEDEVFAINSVCPINVAEAVFPNVVAAEKGRMIFMSSLEGSRRVRTPDSAYSRSKTALNDEIRKYAPEWAQHGVIGIALHPGWVQTDMGGPNAQVSPEISVAGIRWIAEEMGPEHNGGFYNYRGMTLPW